MNILEVSIETKNHCLNKAFKEGTIYLSLPSVTGSLSIADSPTAQATFTVNNGMATLANPVQFAVPAGTKVNMIYIRDDSSLYDTIDLEGDEIVDFSASGIYLISAINISLTERNE